MVYDLTNMSAHYTTLRDDSTEPIRTLVTHRFESQRPVGTLLEAPVPHTGPRVVHTEILHLWRSGGATLQPATKATHSEVSTTSVKT
jgi:hypothetical protein